MVIFNNIQNIILDKFPKYFCATEDFYSILLEVMPVSTKIKCKYIKKYARFRKTNIVGLFFYCTRKKNIEIL